MNKRIVLHVDDEQMIINPHEDFLDEITLNETNDKLIANVWFDNNGDNERLELIECDKIRFPEIELVKLDLDKVKLRGAINSEFGRIYCNETIQGISIKDNMIEVSYIDDEGKSLEVQCKEVGFY